MADPGHAIDDGALLLPNPALADGTLATAVCGGGGVAPLLQLPLTVAFAAGALLWSST